MLPQVRRLFWAESLWCPPNATWAQYETAGYRHFNDLYYATLTALLIFTIRLPLERYVFKRIGTYFFGLPAANPRPAPASNPILERAFTETYGKLKQSQLTALVKQLDMSERSIQRWMRQKTAYSRPTVLAKFAESAWRGSFYLFTFSFGLAVMWNKPWLWDSAYFFIDYPRHFVSSGEWWFYNIEVGFYLSLLLSQFFDIQRKDFWVMFAHHIVALTLLSFSWACNFARIGTMVLVIHDFADITLELSKMMMYAEKQRAADLIFTLFTGCWIVSRLFYFPYRIIYWTTYAAAGLVPFFNAYYVFNPLLVALLVMHFIWSLIIVKMVANSWMNKNSLRDLRSDDEEEEEEREEETEEEVSSD